MINVVKDIRFVAADDEVTALYRDGAYIAMHGDAVQVIVVGPMMHTPGEYGAAVSLHYGVAHEVTSAEFLPAEKEKDRKAILGRGFVSMKFERVT